MISVRGSKALQLSDYSGFPHNWKSGPEPVVLDNVCILRPDSDPEKIFPLRSQVDLFILENSIELYQSAKIFIDVLTRIREAIGYQTALYLPGIALPNNVALLAYLGVDILDSSRAAYLSGQGYFLTQDGNESPDIAREFCPCTACSGKGDVYLHNMLALHSEVMRARSRITNNGIRELIEYRAKTSPKLVEMLRHLDMHYFPYQETRFPAVSSNFTATTRLALGRPDIVRFRNRIIERYRKPATPDILVLLPCSAKKPYSSSKSHGFFAEAIAASNAGPRIHEVIVTSPLGLVPRELELFYPAQHYDIPVTGHWFEDEKLMINRLLKEYLKINNYTHIISHLGDPDLLEGIEAEITTEGGATSNESLNTLTKALAAYSGASVNWKNRSSQEIASMAAFQFGSEARKVFSGCAMAGRYPQLKVNKNKIQLATISNTNGMIVPTIDGAKLLADANIHVVRMADFEITGNLFAVGVEEADPGIRVGDEVVIMRNGELAASGTARMSGEEMTQSTRGEAVRTRHKSR